MAEADTTPEIRRLQLAAYRAMSPDQRLAIALTMSEEIRSIGLGGIRSRNPTFDEDQVRREWLRILHGERLAEALDSVLRAAAAESDG